MASKRFDSPEPDREGLSVKDLELERRVLQLMATKTRVHKIAEIIGMSRENVWHIGQRAKKRYLEENAKLYADNLEADVLALDELLRTFTPRAINGSESAANMVLKIQARKAAMLGTDAATQYAMSKRADAAAAAILVAVQAEFAARLPPDEAMAAFQAVQLRYTAGEGKTSADDT